MPEPNPSLTWDSHDPDALPNLSSRLRFTAHYAVCVVDSESWDNTSLTLRERFTGAKFWDHPGEITFIAPSRSSQSRSSFIPTQDNEGVGWDESKIQSIESGQEVGRTTMSDKQITEGTRHNYVTPYPSLQLICLGFE
jgi:hypothetical protein